DPTPDWVRSPLRDEEGDPEIEAAVPIHGKTDVYRAVIHRRHIERLNRRRSDERKIKRSSRRRGHFADRRHHPRVTIDDSCAEGKGNIESPCAMSIPSPNLHHVSPFIP